METIVAYFRYYVGFRLESKEHYRNYR